MFFTLMMRRMNKMRDLWWLVFDYVDLRQIYDMTNRRMFGPILDQYCQNKLIRYLVSNRPEPYSSNAIVGMLFLADNNSRTVTSVSTEQRFTLRDEPCCYMCGTDCHMCGATDHEMHMYQCDECEDSWDSYNKRYIEHYMCRNCIEICNDCGITKCTDHGNLSPQTSTESKYWETVDKEYRFLCSECAPELYQKCKGCGDLEWDPEYRCCGYCINCHDPGGSQYKTHYQTCKKRWNCYKFV